MENNVICKQFYLHLNKLKMDKKSLNRELGLPPAALALLTVKFYNPNKESVKKIYQSYFSDMSGYENVDLDLIVEKTPDAQGAVIAEIAKRAVRIYHRNGEITTESILACIVTMNYQVEVMNTRPEIVSPAQELYDNLQRMVSEVV